MAAKSPRISVERGTVIDGVTYGCVRQSTEEDHFSFIPAGSYTAPAFLRACRFFDARAEEVTETYVVPEGAHHAGETVRRLATTEVGRTALRTALNDYLATNPRGYRPLAQAS